MNELILSKDQIVQEELLSAADLRRHQAALICEYGNMGWTWDDRCEMQGNCPACVKRALRVMPDKPKTSTDYFAKGTSHD